MTIPSATTRKRELRKQLRAQPVNREAHDERIRESVARWLVERPGARHITCFHPLPDEPDLTPLITRFPDRVWYFPRIDVSGEMSFHLVQSLARDLVPGTMGILEPVAASAPAAPQDIDVFLCPGMAFERTTLNRLGRGKGYYDRYLSNARDKAIFAGVTFPERLVDNTFAEDHDITMHLLFC